MEDPETKRKWYLDSKDLEKTKERYPGLKTFQSKYHILTYDTKWKYQDEELEERYKVFKEVRDHDLQPKVPKDMRKILDLSPSTNNGKNSDY